MRRYDAVIFGLFDTSVNIPWDRLPLVRFDGREIRSRSPRIDATVRAACPGVSVSRFCRAFIEGSREAETLRRMRIGSRRAVFVGDTPEAGVLGPKGVGMDVIRIRRGNAALPSGALPPTHAAVRFAAFRTSSKTMG
mgnify:CR=1 FL=1